MTSCKDTVVQQALAIRVSYMGAERKYERDGPCQLIVLIGPTSLPVLAGGKLQVAAKLWQVVVASKESDKNA